MHTLKAIGRGFETVMATLAFTLALLTFGAAALCATAKAADLRPSTKDTPAHLLPALDLPAQSWTGLWAAALAGYDMSDTEVNLDFLNKGKAQNLFGLDGFGGEGLDVTFQLGGDIQLERVVAGGWVEYSGGSTESSAHLTSAIKLNVDQQESYGVCGRLGTPLGASADTLLYGAGCWVWTTYDADLQIGNTKLSDSFDRSGPAAELGVEHRFTPAVHGKLSARYTWLDEETTHEFAGVNLGNAQIRDETGVFSVKAGLVISTTGLNFGILGGGN